MRMRNRFLWVPLFVMMIVSSFSSAASDVSSANLVPKLKFLTSLDASIASKNVYFEFNGSQKMTDVIRQVLANHGYRMVDTLDKADVKIEIAGGYAITGAGKNDLKGPLGPVVENSLKIDEPSSPDYKHQSVDVAQIAAASIGTGILDLSGIALWVTQQTGIAGRFNQALTGDPRGFCLNENCNKYRNVLNVLVRVLEKRTSWQEDPQHKRGIWLVEEIAYDERILLDLMITSSLEKALSPLLEIKMPANSPVASVEQ